MASGFTIKRFGLLLIGVMGIVCLPVSLQAQQDNEEKLTDSGQIVVPLRGTATLSRNSQLSVAPSSLSLGTVEVGSTESNTWTISHTGDSSAPAVEIGEVTMIGPDASEFSSDFTGYRTLAGGQTLEVSVSLSPLTPGEKSAGLRLSVDGGSSAYVMLFTGEAVFPLTSNLVSSVDDVEFGLPVQNAQSTETFVLSNTGETNAPPINVSSITMSGTNASEFTPDFLPVTLEPGEQVTVEVSLDTSITGFKSALATVFHDGVNAALDISLQGTVIDPAAQTVSFSSSILDTSLEVQRGTSLQFGPDGYLYVAEMDGPIHVLDVTRVSKDNYTANILETINLIKEVQNHNDDGTLDFANKRLLTGIHVTGSATSPIIYAASSDPRQAAGPSGNDVNLDTNSGILHKLTKVGGSWTKQDLVRGLPRSEENHVSNGLVLVDNKIYLNVGGHTNEGAPSNNFAELPEYALSAAVLEIDLQQIGSSTYDIPTLNGPADQFDPFGGHDGLNQAMLVENGPISLFATGLRNAYDIVYTETGRFYTWDNGGNTGWGGPPGNDCSDDVDNGGTRSEDGLHLLQAGYYAGHPNPTRGSKNNTFGGQSPIEGDANPIECEFLKPGVANGALALNGASTNGLDEYTATNFGSAMKGDLLAVSFDKKLYRVQMNQSGTVVTSKSVLMNNVSQTPLDVTTQGDGGVFPGTIWIIDNIVKDITVLEPADY
ncbi:MAG: choice-of-anchor D domain-containing protein [Granulosicoccus sp.]|nr:choice-of-anchor D domain-containing protein [Granulosicoccus sp.]